MKRRIWFALLSLIGFLGYGNPASVHANGVSPSVLVLPSGPGSLGGIGENVSANLNMGLMSYQIKVLVPAGRGDATPNPSITYSSSAGSSMLGIGWSFSSGPAIMRGTVRGLPTYTNEDVFFAGGELVKLPKGPFYRSRYEGGFVRYEWKQKDSSDQEGYWIAQYPNGTKHYYGADSQGNTRDSAQIKGLKGTYKWELVTIVDRNGNRVEYTYTKDGPKTYPDTISWVFDKQNKPLYQLRFKYESRKDFISDGKPGFDLVTKKRLQELTITSAGIRFRSYSFGFEDSTGLSRLVEVTRYGRDENKAYPVQFSMRYSDATLDENKLKLVVMPTSTASMSSNNTDFVDINGDGLPDVVDTTAPKHTFFINQLTLDKDLKQVGHDFPKALVKQNPNETSAKLSNASVQLLDVNGDGFTDLVDAVNMKIYANKGNGKWEDTSETLVSFPVDGKNPDMRFFDYNGDKKIDVIASDGSTTQYWVNDGKGSWKPVRGDDNIGLSFSRDKLKLIDMNGDGLQDIVHITEAQLRYKKYLGYGKWSQWINVTVDLTSIKGLPLNRDAQFQDINGDGMSDMVLVVGNKIYYMVNSNGNQFSDAKELSTGNLNIPDTSQSSLRIVDINGNGSRDIVWIDNNGKVTYLELFDKRPNLMTQISNGIGQRINVDYGSSVNFFIRDATCNKDNDKACAGPWENKMPMAFTVVTGITTWAARSQQPLAQAQPTADERPQIQKIYYHHGFYDGKEKKYRGFRHVETLFDGDASMQARKETIRYDVGDKDTYMHGKLLEQSTSDGNGKIFRKQNMTYGDCPVELGGIDGKSLPFPIRFICMKSTESIIMEGLTDQSKWKTTRTEQQYDGFGNITMSINLGEKDKEGDEQVTKMTYIVPSNPNEEGSKWLIRYPSKAENCSSKNGPCSLTEYYYDGDEYKGLPLGQVTKGNVTRIRQRVTAGEFVEPTRRKYDQYGNLIGSKNAVGQQRTYEWDGPFARFAVKEVLKMEGYDLTMSVRWDYAQNKVVESTDVNGNTKRYTYDSFGRLTQEFQEGDDKASIKYSYALQAPLSMLITEIRSKKNGELDRKTVRCFDGLGRNLSTLVMTTPGKFLTTKQTSFNREGQSAQTWNNYSSDGTCTFDAPANTPITKFYYDSLKRKVRTELPNGAIQRTVYEPFKTIIFDAEDNTNGSAHFDTPRTAIFDGLGRTIEEILIPKKGETITKQFSYDNANVKGAQLITKVVLADGSEKKQEFDELGRLVKIIDPDRSTTSFTYREDGRLASSTDARNIKILFTYDGLGRIISKQQSGKDDTKVSYQYDTLTTDFKEAKNLKGRLTKASYPGGTKLFSYDERGSIVAQRHIFMGHNFDFVMEYDNTNFLRKETYPDGRSIEVSRDLMGRTTAVSGRLKSIVYNSNGLIASETFANGIVSELQYDKLLRMTQIKIADGKVSTYDYTYSASNNPTTIKQIHGETTFTNKYTYDAVYRLTQANVGTDGEVMNYEQNKLHNITNKSSSLGDKSPAHIGEYKYDAKKIHAATQAGNIKLKYDDVGNMLQRGDITMTWDYMNRLVEAKRGDQIIARNWYGEQNRRIIKEEGGVYTFYINPYYEIREGAILSYLKTGLDRRVASWTVKGVEAFFDDIDKDGKITASDTWRYHANRDGISKATVKKRPFDLNLTKTMLQSSAMRMLLGDKEVNHFYHADHLGNVRAVTNDQGDVLKRMHYHPYGAIRAQSGNTNIFSYGYQGQEYDKAIGVWAYLNRSLDPKLGRWLSADPAFRSITEIGDEFNSYGMVENNPITYRDKRGNNKFLGAAGAALVGVIATAAITATQSEPGDAGYSAGVGITAALTITSFVTFAIGVILAAEPPKSESKTSDKQKRRNSDSGTGLPKRLPKNELSQLTNTYDAPVFNVEKRRSISRRNSLPALDKQNSLTLSLTRKDSLPSIARRNSSPQLNKGGVGGSSIQTRPSLNKQNSGNKSNTKTRSRTPSRNKSTKL